ncbi:TPM domain-containing protein, partial [Mycobacterium sp. Marseille-P9652]|uniref:TPM domain-containing protein n=1 Tax=Mycobacterium sp. Marseille-P9652 TaxID=2654950 RepID=UPI0018D1A4FB
ELEGAPPPATPDRGGVGATPPAPTQGIPGPNGVVGAPGGAPPAATGARGRWRGPATVIGALAAVALLAVAAFVGVHALRGHSGKSAAGGATSRSATPQTGGATAAPTTPALTLTTQLTDQSNVLGPLERGAVERAINNLYATRGTKLWVVYVPNFGGLKPFRWADNVMRGNGLADTDAILAVATDEPAFSFRVPGAITNGRAIDVEMIRRDRISPAVFRHEWARAAIAAAQGLDVAPG